MKDEYKSADAKARRAARRAGLVIQKQGGYMLADPKTKYVVLGARHDASADDVVSYCRAWRDGAKRYPTSEALRAGEAARASAARPSWAGSA